MTPRTIRLTRLAQCLLAFTAVACAVPINAARIVVLTTNTILADMTREITGEAAEIQCLVPPGIDLHGFDPTPRDIAPILEAQLVVANGAGFEPWLAHFLGASGYSGPVATASDGCALLERANEDHAHEENYGDAGHAHGETDPHAWHDPSVALRYVANIREALCQVDPAGAENYRRRARLYSAQIEALDAWARRLFALVPAERRRIITAHDSLAYFGRAYGFEILALRGLDSRAEPDARHLAMLVDRLRGQQISAIFGESVSPSRTLEQLARDTGATLGAELFTDSVAAAGSPADSYLGMLRENTLRVLAAIEAAPAGPAR